MGSPPTDPQRPPDDDRRIENATTKPDEAGSAPAGGYGRAVGSSPRPGSDASDRTVRYLMGPTAFCAYSGPEAKFRRKSFIFGLALSNFPLGLWNNPEF